MGGDGGEGCDLSRARRWFGTAWTGRRSSRSGVGRADGQTGCRREGELAYHLLMPPAGTSTPSVETCRPRPRMKAVGCPQGTIIHLRSTSPLQTARASWSVPISRQVARFGQFLDTQGTRYTMGRTNGGVECHEPTEELVAIPLWRAADCI